MAETLVKEIVTGRVVDLTVPFANYRAELLERVAKMVENEELECYECGTWYNFGPLAEKIRKMGNEDGK